MDENNLKKNEVKDTEARDRLPASMLDRSSYSIWSILKQCMDKELYRFSIPIIWNEPLSLLQRMSENMTYAPILLENAAKNTNEIERMKFVAAFLVSSVSMHGDRVNKPFNPLLGETYEFTNDSYRICFEQVSHHPPISAFMGECLTKTDKNLPKYKHYGSVYPQMKLNLFNASLDALAEGVQTIELPEFDEIYTWYNAKVCAHNLIIGKLWFEYNGVVKITNHKSNITCILEFKPYSWFSGVLNKVEGYILDAAGNKVSLLSGQWDKYFLSCDNINFNEFYKYTDETFLSDKNINKMKLLWKSDLKKTDLMPEYYNYSKFTFSLNELNEKLKACLPRTDSRFRPDMRELENGDIELASQEKNRLEEKQRHAAQKNEHAKILWFSKATHKITNDDTWTFNDEYWKRDYKNCSDIF